MSEFQQRQFVLDRPIIIKRPKKKKKKRSRAMADYRYMERRLIKAGRRTVKSLDAGLVAYDRASRRSSRRGRRRLLADLLPNAAKGTAVTMREMSLVPYHLVRAGSSAQARRLSRRMVRMTLDLTDWALP